VTRKEAIEKLRQHFIQTELNDEGTKISLPFVTEEDVLDELDNQFNNAPSKVGEFIIDILTNDKEETTTTCGACGATITTKSK